MDQILKLLNEAFIVMLMGMGIVFIFLVILVITISISGIIIRVLKLEKEEVKDTITPKSDDKEIIATIVAAIRNYK